MTQTPKADPRTIEYLPLSALKHDPANPKAHDLDTLDASVGRFGVLDPIVRDGRTGFIVSGHGRANTLARMQDRHETPPEGVRVDKDGAWLVPVVTGWSSRTDTEAHAALIALNRTTELGGWVDESLMELLGGLEEDENGFVGVGFDADDLDDLRARLEEAAPAPSTDDGDGTMESPSLKEYSQRYEEQGRRLIVLDYDKDGYGVVVARLKELRRARGVETNSEAVAELLAEMYPDVTPLTAEEDSGAVFDDEFRDPAATL